MDTSHVLSMSVTPVVLTSACALVTLALYNRLGVILARIRAFHLQKIELLRSLPEHEVVEPKMLLEMLDSQIAEVTVKARMIQKSLCCLLAAIAAFLLCSFFAGATELHAGSGAFALGMGILGLFLFLFALGWAMRELTRSLTPLEAENAYLDVLMMHHLTKVQAGKRLKVAERA